MICFLLIFLLVSSLSLLLFKYHQKEKILLIASVGSGLLCSLVFGSITFKYLKQKKEEKSLYEILDLYLVFSFIIALVATVLMFFLTKNISFSVFSFFFFLLTLLFFSTKDITKDMTQVVCTSKNCKFKFFVNDNQTQEITCPQCGKKIS